MSKLQIIGAPQSTYTRTVRIAAHEMGIDCEHAPAAPHTPDVDDIHPLGKIPVMRHGDIALCESRAIIAYLEAAFDGPKLAPDDPVAAARAEQWVSMLTTHMIPKFVGDYLFAYIFPGTADGLPDRARIEAVQDDIEALLGLLGREIETSGWLGADRFNLADAYLAPVLSYLKDLPESGAIITANPALSQYVKACEDRPSIQATRVPEAATA
ncbi:MAG: glutathione S-transferase family protein [Maricaulaceae bacterium]|jgi:glutathione S-transferase